MGELNEQLDFEYSSRVSIYIYREDAGNRDRWQELQGYAAEMVRYTGVSS